MEQYQQEALPTGASLTWSSWARIDALLETEGFRSGQSFK